MGKVMRHTLGASLNIRHNLSSSKGPKPLQLKLLTTYIPKTSAFTLAFRTSRRRALNRMSVGLHAVLKTLVCMLHNLATWLSSDDEIKRARRLVVPIDTNEQH